MGYCLLSPAIALIFCRLIVTLFEKQTTLTFFIRLAVTIFGFSWATFGKKVFSFSFSAEKFNFFSFFLASHAFLAGYYPQGRRALAIYPIFLFYFVISWLIVSHTHYGHMPT